MRFDETDLIEFFGVLPVEQNTEEKEFFGSSEFEAVREKFTLHISFSRTHSPKVILDLFHSDAADPILHVDIRDAAVIRMDQKSKDLAVLTTSEHSHGSDPELETKLRISLNPLKVTVCS